MSAITKYKIGDILVEEPTTYLIKILDLDSSRYYMRKIYNKEVPHFIDYIFWETVKVDNAEYIRLATEVEKLLYLP